MFDYLRSKLNLKKKLWMKTKKGSQVAVKVIETPIKVTKKTGNKTVKIKEKFGGDVDHFK